jgi:four helix bundle protein
MNNSYSGTDKDIHNRIFKYIVVGLKVIRETPKTLETTSILDQVCRSLTSMGANDQEADAAITRKDFAAKYSIVLKETKETIYWWKILKELGSKHKEIDWLIPEGGEIFRVVSVIIKNSKISH